MDKTIKIVTGIVVVILIVGAIWFFVDQKQKQGKIKIGIMTMTTGDLAYLGDNVVKSANLAAKELGYSDKIQFVVEDVGNLSAGETTVTGYQKLVDVDGVQVIIDGMTSDGTLAVAPLLAKDKVSMITPLTGGKNVDDASSYLFRNGPSDILAGIEPAQDIYNKFGFKKVALFTDNAQYSIDISKNFRSAYKGSIVFDDTINPDQTDYRTDVTKMQTKGADAILINTADGTSSSYIIKELYEAGNKIPIFSNFIAFNDNALTIAGKQAFEGVYIYDPQFDENSPATQSFFSDYNKTYSENPAIPFQSTGTYDDVKMIMQAINNVGYNGTAIRDYLLKNVKNWQGLNGVVSFDAKGDIQTGFTLKQVKNSKLVTVN